MAITRVSWTDDDGTGTTGTIINAAQLTAIYDSIETSWPWVSYTPTWTGAGGNPAIVNGTLSGRYLKIGKKVNLDIYVLMGASTTFGSGAWSFALPVTAADQNGQILAASLLDTGTQWYSAMAFLQSTTTIGLTWHGNTGGNAAATAPFVWASGDVIRITGSYVAA